MKKTFILLTTLLFFSFFTIVKAEEECNNYYKVSISIEGKGTLEVNNSDKSFTKNGTVNVKCGDNFIFTITPDEENILKGVYSNGNYLASDSNKYAVMGVSSNVNVKVIFGKEEESKENEILFQTFEDSISLYIADIKEELEDNTTLKLLLNEVTVIFDKEFIKSSSDNITLEANQIYKEDLNIKEQKAAKNSVYYEIILYNGEKIVDKIKGTATIKVPYSKSNKVYVYKVDKDGKLTFIDSKLKDGNVSFKVEELGIFALSKEELDELGYVRNLINLNNRQKIAIIAVGSALALLIAFIKFKKRK